ncbi:hypothetical protein [Rudaea cellulosilytica]|uniref:hypothetical protein n=1 Tax=Rudaea cellulosilytica TaxID=540746 RepID=UPI00039B4726|nr:hypothetical protein [Rudaea cellulosilytica]
MSAEKIREVVVPPFGIRQKFESQEAVLDFVAKETTTWSEWVKRVTGVARVAGNLQSNDDLPAHWARIREQIKRQDDGSIVGGDQAVGVLQELLNQRRVVLSTTATGASILNLADTSPALSSFLMSISRSTNLGPDLNNYGNQTLGFAVTALLEAIPAASATKTVKRHAQEVREAAEQSASLLARTLENTNRSTVDGATLVLNLQSTLNEGRSDLARMLRLSRANARDQRRSFNDDWTALRRTYDLKLKTKSPFSYWRGKERLHRRSVGTWRNYMMWILAIGFPATISSALLLSSYKTEGPVPWLTFAIVVGGCAFVTVWLARLANRQLVDQLLRMEDARERSIMVRTLLAFSRQDNSGAIASEANINAMLSALYRPGPGLSADDSPSISLVEAVMKSIQGSRGTHP